MALCRLSDNGIGFEGARALAPSLAANRTLTTLDVSYNDLDIGGAGVKLLRGALQGREGFCLVDRGNC